MLVVLVLVVLALVMTVKLVVLVLVVLALVMTVKLVAPVGSVMQKMGPQAAQVEIQM